MRFRILAANLGAVDDDWNPWAGGELLASKKSEARTYIYLASRAGKAVPIRELEKLNWPEPFSRSNTRAGVTEAVSFVNKKYRQWTAAGREPEQLIAFDSRNDSYTFRAESGEVDLLRMATLASEADRHLRANEYDLAETVATDALALWPDSTCGLLYESFEDVLRKARRARYLASVVLADISIANNCAESAVAVLQRLTEDEDVRDLKVWVTLQKAYWLSGDPVTARAIADVESDVHAPAELTDALRANVQALGEQSDRVSADPAAGPAPIISGNTATFRDTMAEETRQRLDELDPGDTPERVFDEIIATADISSRFRMFFVSGVSAAGKDTLVHYASVRGRRRERFTVLNKYTTRPQRSGEAAYSHCVSEDEFGRMMLAGELVWVYEKREMLYGFDSASLIACMRAGGNLVAVFTEVDEVPRIAAKLKESGIDATCVFIEVDAHTARLRTRIRGLGPAESERRTDSIFEDLERIRDRGDEIFRSEYFFIQNSNDNDINSATRHFLTLLGGNS